MPKSRNRHAEPPSHPITGEIMSRFLDELGREVLDETPMEPPIGYNRTPSLAEQMRTMVQSELLARHAREAGADTFEEADDFDVGDDFDPSSPYEEQFEPELPAESPPPSEPQPTSPQPAPEGPAEGGEGVAPSPTK